MRKYIFRAFLAILALAWASCQKDNQRFVYDKLNTVSIKTADSSFVITQLDTLSIQTQLTESIPSGDSYTYEWKAYMVGENAVILSDKKDLKVAVNLSPGSYDLIYTVTSVKTGISSFMLYPLTVNGAFYEGWLVAANQDGKARLSFIRANDSVFFSPAEDVNKTTYPGKALGVNAGITSSYANLALVMFYTDQGVYRFNADNFIQNGTTADIFPEPKQFSASCAYAMSKIPYDQYIVADGGLYAGIGPLFYPQDVLKPYSERLTGDYNLFPVVINSATAVTLFYDNKYRRFMSVPLGDRMLSPVSASPGAVFNMADVGKKMIGWDYGTQSVISSDEIYFVMQDDAGIRYLYSLKGATPELSQQIGNSPDIEKASAFAASGVVKHLYYAAGNKIYLYDILANSSKMVYTFPDGVKIKDLKMLSITSKRIVVATNTGTAGEVYYFDLDNLGDIVNHTYVKKFTGFGEIINLSYRSAN